MFAGLEDRKAISSNGTCVFCYDAFLENEISSSTLASFIIFIFYFGFSNLDFMFFSIRIQALIYGVKILRKIDKKLLVDYW